MSNLESQTLLLERHEDATYEALRYVATEHNIILHSVQVWMEETNKVFTLCGFQNIKNSNELLAIYQIH